MTQQPDLSTKSQEPENQSTVTAAAQHRRLNKLPSGIHVGKLTDVGRERERNEDSFYVASMLVQHELGQEKFGIFIVADGMGGHQKGEKASVVAVRAAASSLMEDVYMPYLSNDQNANNRPLNEALRIAVERANQTVVDIVPEGGTTLLIALIMGNNAYIAHVGDSRAYHYKNNSLKQITEDHSLAKKLEQAGQSAEETKQVQNILYRAIGQGDTIETDTHMQYLAPGSSLLLCSDGLWGLITSEDIIKILNAAATPQDACTQLVSLANENGGKDNITAIVVSIGIEDLAS